MGGLTPVLGVRGGVGLTETEPQVVDVVDETRREVGVIRR